MEVAAMEVAAVEAAMEVVMVGVGMAVEDWVAATAEGEKER